MVARRVHILRREISKCSGCVVKGTHTAMALRRTSSERGEVHCTPLKYREFCMHVGCNALPCSLYPPFLSHTSATYHSIDIAVSMGTQRSTIIPNGATNNPRTPPCLRGSWNSYPLALVQDLNAESCRFSISKSVRNTEGQHVRVSPPLARESCMELPRDVVA
jgi:hypothetical protein